MKRHPDSADGDRPEHGALAHREYSLLAPEEPMGKPASARPHGRGDNPDDTSEAGGIDREETGMGEWNGQGAPLARRKPEYEEEERGPPERQRTFNACSHHGGEGGGIPHTSACASRMHPGDGGVHPDQAAKSPSAQPGDGGGGGAPTKHQHALPAHNLQEREREGGTPPE